MRKLRRWQFKLLRVRLPEARERLRRDEGLKWWPPGPKIKDINEELEDGSPSRRFEVRSFSSLAWN